MFGFGLKSKAKRVLRAEFFYKSSFMNNSTFNRICQQGDRVGQNEYSVAIFYILAKMNLLVEKIRSYQDYEYFAEDRSGMHAFDRIRGNYNEAEYFIGFHGSILNRIIYQANSSKSEINSMMNEINQKLLGEKRTLLCEVLKKNVIWDENEVELRVAEIHKEDKERSVSTSTSQAAALMMAHSQLAYELIEEKYEDMLRNLSFEEIVRRIGINIDEMKFIDAQYSDEIHGHETNLRGKGMLRSKTSDNKKNLNSNSTQQQNESSGSEELDNPFEIGDEKRAWLSIEIKAFVACIEATKFFIHEKIKEKDLEISKDDINYIRAFQLYGALDFIAQNEGWTPEQIIEPFITICLTEHPNTFGLAVNPGKILGFMNNPNVLARFPEIQQIQINGAYLYDDTKSLPIRTSMDKQPFSDAMMVAAEKNTSEILELISIPLIDSFKTLNE